MKKVLIYTTSNLDPKSTALPDDCSTDDQMSNWSATAAATDRIYRTSSKSTTELSNTRETSAFPLHINGESVPLSPEEINEASRPKLKG